MDTYKKPLNRGTPLYITTTAGHLSIVELFIKKGWNIKVCGAKGYKPLLLALLVRHEEIAIFLFNKMSDLNSPIIGDAGYTSLYTACLR